MKTNCIHFYRPAELENNLGIADRTLSEFVIGLSEGKQNVKEFRAVLVKEGAEMPDSLIETLWNVIQRMKPGGKAASGASGRPQLPAIDAPYGGLAIPNTRDFVKQMEAEMIAEGEAKQRDARYVSEDDRRKSHSEASTDEATTRLPRSRSRSPPGHRNRDRGENRSRDETRSRDSYRADKNVADRRQDDRRRRGIEKGGRHRSRSASPPRGRSPPRQVLDEPEMYAVYKGRVTNVMDFGCFVELQGFRSRTEGLVHASNISATKRSSAKELVNKNDSVWVKVVSRTGQRLGLSMRDVDQATGEDLLPLNGAASGANGAPIGRGRAPGPSQGPSSAFGNRSALHGLSGINLKSEADGADGKPRRRGRRMTSPERWEISQLIKSGVLDPSEYPDFDDEAGGRDIDAEVEEEFEVDINEDEPLFLKGVSSKTAGGVSPIKVVKNPDGSLQRAAMTQSALAKERRELQQQQQRTVLEAIPKDLSRPWEVPFLTSLGRAALSGDAAAR